MRIPIKRAWGSEVILSEEDKLTLSEINLKKSNETFGGKEPFDQIFYIDEGVVDAVIGNSIFEWGYSKTFSIKSNTVFDINVVSEHARLFRLAFGRKKHETFEPK
jgi:hypothetical protein